MARSSMAFTVACVVALCVCGTLNTVTMKISYTMDGVGLSGEKTTFQKPWFTTFVMFVSMSGALVCEAIRGGFRNQKSASSLPLMYESAAAVDAPISWSRKVVYVAIPASFDILATGLCSMGFLYLPASVWQLLRGAEMVFAALFAVTCLKRTLFAFHYLGLLCCIVGITAVGFASVWGDAEASKDAGQAHHSHFLLFLGMGLALSGQVVQAAQVIAEEWILKDVDLPALQIIGFEGVWGVLLMVALVFPIVYNLSGNDIGGRMEDEVDALVMIQSNNSLLFMQLLYTFSCMTYNMAGIAVTDALSAVHRVMLEALRTAGVWIFGLLVNWYDPSSAFGEKWTSFSYLEVFGFVMLIIGQAVYGTMVRIPGLYYPPAESAMKNLTSPGAMKNFGSPLPPAYARQDRTASDC